MRDVTQQKRAHDELERLARYDTLTGLLNRRALLERLEEWLRHVQRYGGKFCVIMLDLDHFKQVNDDYGHQVGDRVLAHTAEVLRQGLRQTDIVGRYGGEEFLVVLPHTDCIGARVVAERIRTRMTRTSMDNGKGYTFAITVSLGIAAHLDNDDVDSLVSRADRALYNAKENGRNRVKVLEE
jgi:diguanylate cyclase (GGDEF)-like protein